MSSPDNYEQYMLELVNRERAAAGVQPLAFDGNLNEAAEGHSGWMIATDTFSHTGASGSDAGARMTSAGFLFAGSWTWGENVAWVSERSSTGSQDEIELLHTNLMNSPGHKANILNGAFQEVGIGFEVGGYQSYTAAFATQNFARTATNPFITGVAFDDKDGDSFYDPGEGLAGLQVQAVSSTGAIYTTATYASGGYDLAVPAGTYTVTFSGPGIAAAVKTVTIGEANIKVDLVDPALTASSDQLPAPALPSGSAPPVGTSAADVMVGTAGNDRLVGNGGNDTLDGSSGDDLLIGGLQKDSLTGGDGSDQFDFNLIKESRSGAARDVITDFQHGQDTIDLSTIDAVRGGGNQTFSWIGSDAFSGDAGELRFARGLIQGDTDGDKRADFEIRVTGSVTAGDLIL